MLDLTLFLSLSDLFLFPDGLGRPAAMDIGQCSQPPLAPIAEVGIALAKNDVQGKICGGERL